MGLEFPRCCYRVDANDRLVWVDQWWLAFARENGGGELCDVSGILGRPLWDFVAGEPLRSLYGEIHEKVRRSGQSVVLPIRCDSPMMRRQTQLTINAEESGGLLYDAVLVRARPHGPIDLLDPAAPRSREPLTVCSVCKRGLDPAVGWLELEELTMRSRYFDRDPLPHLEHTICADCETIVESARDFAA
jgi:hypothetical protein